ncbi:3-isopropylmalate dehydratase small subunit [Variovorax sp. RHLX14]|uniref:3-isopropylmalate dehydratase small subunit n=1 Tax=Variovorax sp. RHLX14 TaxID=1259731 RepID=UPI003F462178
MRAFRHLKSRVVPIDRANIDTDAIISKQFMKSIRRTGYGENLFDQWRYLDHGEPGMDNSTRPLNRDFALNQPRYAGAQVLLTRENFGCGSSREHAPWALWDFGFRALIAPSFADIFHGNCFKNGILPIVLAHSEIDDLFACAQSAEGLTLEIDLERQSVTNADGTVLEFGVDGQLKHRLLNGLDDISMTLADTHRIVTYEEKRRAIEPWLFD